MNCYVHTQKEAIGTCVNCGKFICKECNTEIRGKNYCKNCVGELFEEKNREFEKLEQKNNNPNPMVFMNAGGGGASSSSSSSSSSSAAGYGRGAVPPYPRNSIIIHIILFLFTVGIGNIVYFIYIRNKQNQWNHMYR